MGSILGRLFDIARSRLHDAAVEEAGPRCRPSPADSSDQRRAAAENDGREDGGSRLAPYYANLEIPDGSDLATARAAWKRLMKQYHPDLHSGDPQKVRVANELSARLTEAYRALEAVLSNGQG